MYTYIFIYINTCVFIYIHTYIYTHTQLYICRISLETHTRTNKGTSLVVQWVRLCSQCRALGSIPGQGTRSHMHATTGGLHATTEKPACSN